LGGAAQLLTLGYIHAPMKCKTCDGEMIQKSRVRLITVGLVQMALIAVAFRFSWFWAPGIILFIAGAYLIVWGTLGHGGWCRNCKKFSLF
jgi:hypothetical protein